MQITFTSHVSKYLAEKGFAPVGTKTACIGTKRDWTHEDGRKALVRYALLSRTGQSSNGNALWGFVVKIDEAAGH
jgi:hypothetical protein